MLTTATADVIAEKGIMDRVTSRTQEYLKETGAVAHCVRTKLASVAPSLHPNNAAPCHQQIQITVKRALRWCCAWRAYFWW